jgi:gluconokinase
MSNSVNSVKSVKPASSAISSSVVFPKSPTVTTGGIVHFARMLDKARLHKAGKLPADYTGNLGDAQPGTFDQCTLAFLGVKYADVLERLDEGLSDDAILDWCFANSTAGKPSQLQIAAFNAFLSKMGWRDDCSDFIANLKKDAGLEKRDDIQTFFDIIEADEGRLPAPAV